MLESKFQADLVQELKEIFPGCIVLKNDSAYLQGIPDLTVLYQKHWFVLEVKRSLSERYQPNQEWYLDMLDNMSYAAMICPENKEEVLRDIYRTMGRS